MATRSAWPGETFRLVGFDAPETYRARCPSERDLGNRATFRPWAFGGSESPPPKRVAWRSYAATARSPPRSQFGATGRVGPSLTGSESEPVRRDERTERGAAKRLTELAVMVARIALAVAVTAKQKRSVAPGGGPPKNRADEEQFSRGWAEPPRSVGSADSAPPTPPVPNRNR
jgi:hypothetical protein